jgi:hypothetical protein
LATLIVTAAVSSAVSAAPANDPIAQGIALRKAGDDQGALPLFEKGYEAKHAPRAAAQLGLCEQALGRWLDAETHLTEALKASGDAWVEKNRGALDAALVVVKSHIGRLEIAGEPAGATVTVNGIEAGKLPLAEPVRVPAGEVQVELVAPGFNRASRTVRIEGGATQRIALRGEREATAAPVVATAPTPEPAAAAPSDASTTAAATVTQKAPEPEAGPAWRKPVRWVSLGLGAASLGVGIYGLLHNRSIVDNQFDPACGIDQTGAARARSGSMQTDSGCADLKSQYETATKIGWGGLIGAGLFTAVGVTIWLTDPAPGPVQTALRGCGLTPIPGNLSLACAFRF